MSEIPNGANQFDQPIARKFDEQSGSWEPISIGQATKAKPPETQPAVTPETVSVEPVAAPEAAPVVAPEPVAAQPEVTPEAAPVASPATPASPEPPAPPAPEAKAEPSKEDTSALDKEVERLRKELDKETTETGKFIRAAAEIYAENGTLMDKLDGATVRGEQVAAPADPEAERARLLRIRIEELRESLDMARFQKEHYSNMYRSVIASNIELRAQLTDPNRKPAEPPTDDQDFDDDLFGTDEEDAAEPILPQRLTMDGTPMDGYPKDSEEDNVEPAAAAAKTEPAPVKTEPAPASKATAEDPFADVDDKDPFAELDAEENPFGDVQDPTEEDFRPMIRRVKRRTTLNPDADPSLIEEDYTPPVDEADDTTEEHADEHNSDDEHDLDDEDGHHHETEKEQELSELKRNREILYRETAGPAAFRVLKSFFLGRNLEASRNNVEGLRKKQEQDDRINALLEIRKLGISVDIRKALENGAEDLSQDTIAQIHAIVDFIRTDSQAASSPLLEEVRAEINAQAEEAGLKLAPNKENLRLYSETRLKLAEGKINKMAPYFQEVGLQLLDVLIARKAALFLRNVYSKAFTEGKTSTEDLAVLSELRSVDSVVKQAQKIDELPGGIEMYKDLGELPTSLAKAVYHFGTEIDDPANRPKTYEPLDAAEDPDAAGYVATLMKLKPQMPPAVETYFKIQAFTLANRFVSLPKAAENETEDSETHEPAPAKPDAAEPKAKTDDQKAEPKEESGVDESDLY